MKTFKHIFLMITMLGGSSAFGAAYLKPALCGGLVGSALALSMQFLAVHERINKDTKEIGEKNNAINFYKKYFGHNLENIPQKLRLQLCCEKPQEDMRKQWRNLLNSKSEYYNVMYDRDGDIYRLRVTPQGMKDMQHKVMFGPTAFSSLIDIASQSSCTAFKNFIEESYQRAQVGYLAYKSKKHESLMLAKLTLFYSYSNKLSVAKGFGVGAVCFAALKYALTRRL